MLALLLSLMLLSIALVIGYWSTRLYPTVRPFRYSHHSEPRLPLSTTTGQMQTLASKYQLHERIKECDTDAERVTAVLRWVYERWEPQPGNKAGTDNALEILTRAHKGERFDRSDYVTVLANALQALEIPARLLEIHSRDSHWRPWRGYYRGLEVFLRDQHRWCWVDAQANVLILNKGRFCSALDIKDALLDRDNRLELLSTRCTTDIDRYLTFLAPFLDILITRPLGQQRRFALVPPQLKFPRRHHGLGRELYDQLCHSRDVFYASHPATEQWHAPLRRMAFRLHSVSA